MTEINCCPPATTAQVLESIREALAAPNVVKASAAQKIAALEAAILLIEGDRHAAPVEARIGESLKQWARSNEEARAAVAEVPPTLEQVLDDAIAHRDFAAVKRLLHDIAKQDGATVARLMAKLQAGFGSGPAWRVWANVVGDVRSAHA